MAPNRTGARGGRQSAVAAKHGRCCAAVLNKKWRQSAPGAEQLEIPKGNGIICQEQIFFYVSITESNIQSSHSSMFYHNIYILLITFTAYKEISLVGGWGELKWTSWQECIPLDQLARLYTPGPAGKNLYPLISPV